MSQPTRILFLFVSMAVFVNDFWEPLVMGQTTQAVCPPERMTVRLTGNVSLTHAIPLAVTLYSKTNTSRRYTNYSFMFVLLDEEGQQVGGPHMFIRESVPMEMVLEGTEATYRPRLMFYRKRPGLIPGRKYQLIGILPAHDLAAAAWFTLHE